MARYEKAKVVRASNKAQASKSTYYREVAQMSAYQASDLDSETLDEEKTSQAEICMAEFTDG